MSDIFPLPYPYDHVIFDLFILDAFVQFTISFVPRKIVLIFRKPLPMHVELVVILVYSIKVYV